MADHVIGPVTLSRGAGGDRYIRVGDSGQKLEDRAATAEESALITQTENTDAIVAALNTAIQNNIAGAAAITAVGTKANGYANNPATDLPTTTITTVLKDVCAGIVITSQAILECQRQLVGLERLRLGQLDTTAGS